MKKKIKNVFFDLDHTLWDYDKNASETLSEMFDKFELSRGFSSTQAFIDAFLRYNNELWGLYNHGKINREGIRTQRFAKVLAEGELSEENFHLELSDFFISNCPRKKSLIPGSFEILDYLSADYRLGLLTNGFSDTQQIKIECSDLAPYFECMVTSESANARKPDPKIFDHALGEMNAESHETVIIGDNFDTDITGGLNANWSCIWLTPSNNPLPAKCHAVKALTDIKTLL